MVEALEKCRFSDPASANAAPACPGICPGYPQSAFGSNCYELLKVEITLQVVERFVVDLPRSVKADELGASGRNGREDDVVVGGDVSVAFLRASEELRRER